MNEKYLKLQLYETHILAKYFMDLSLSIEEENTLEEIKEKILLTLKGGELL